MTDRHDGAKTEFRNNEDAFPVLPERAVSVAKQQFVVNASAEKAVLTADSNNNTEAVQQRNPVGVSCWLLLLYIIAVVCN